MGVHRMVVHNLLAGGSAWAGSAAGALGVLPPLNPKADTLNPKPETLNPKPETRNQKPETLNPKPETLHPKP